VGNVKMVMGRASSWWTLWESVIHCYFFPLFCVLVLRNTNALNDDAAKEEKECSFSFLSLFPSFSRVLCLQHCGSYCVASRRLYYIPRVQHLSFFHYFLWDIFFLFSIAHRWRKDTTELFTHLLFIFTSHNLLLPDECKKKRWTKYYELKCKVSLIWQPAARI
jgi:hypothetical protein